MIEEKVETPAKVRIEMQDFLCKYYINEVSDSFMLEKHKEYRQKGYCHQEFFDCYLSYLEEKKYKK